jgi:hypothetical protein
VQTCWQPSLADDTNVLELREILQWLTNVHVFQWQSGTGRRLPLAAGSSDWQKCLAAVSSTGRDHFALLEFVEGDAPINFLRDAGTLKYWLTET